MTQAGEKLIRAARDARVKAAIQAERIRAAGICVAEARAWSRAGVNYRRSCRANNAEPQPETSTTYRALRANLLFAARRIMGKT